MRRTSLDIYRAPRSGATLEVASVNLERAGDILQGTLRDTATARLFPVTNGIPRFVEGETYASSFAFQWERYRRTQLDRFNGTAISHERLLSNTGWCHEVLQGRRVLEVGCGAGRFTEVLLEAGAEVYAMDLSTAVDSCLANNDACDRLHVAQADVFALPYAKTAFDKILCYGVLQHTPNPSAAFRNLLPFLKPGGELAIDVYRRTLWITRWTAKYWYRPITRRLRADVLARIVEWYVPRWLDIDNWFQRIPVMRTVLPAVVPCWNYSGVLPLSRQQIVEWAVLDTFDALSARYDLPQTEKEVRSWFEDAGLIDVSIRPGGNGILGNAKMPAEGRVTSEEAPHQLETIHVLLVSDFETQGGAAIGTSRLAEALLASGARVSRAVYVPDGQPHPWKTRWLIGGPRERIAWEMIQAAARRVSFRLALLTQAAWVHARMRRLLAELKPDVIGVGNLHGAHCWPTLVGVCAAHAPTAWTLRDMWPLTGRCAYSYECRKFETGCDSACPTPNEYPALAPRFIGPAWKARSRLLARHPELVAVCPSRWMANEARAGLWKALHVEVIPNAVPLELYKPIDRGLARDALGVGASGWVLGTAAEDLTARRKGGYLLLEALRMVAARPLTLLTLGRGQSPQVAGGITVRSMGYVDHERTKALFYNALDLFVHPAPVDNLPHVVMESIACGTPVVGFKVGGIPDMVRPRNTGWLADSLSPSSLAQAIEEAIHWLRSQASLRSTCRSAAEAEYSFHVQGQRYLALFNEMIAARRRRSRA